MRINILVRLLLPGACGRAFLVTDSISKRMDGQVRRFLFFSTTSNCGDVFSRLTSPQPQPFFFSGPGHLENPESYRRERRKKGEGYTSRRNLPLKQYQPFSLAREEGREEGEEVQSSFRLSPSSWALFLAKSWASSPFRNWPSVEEEEEGRREDQKGKRVGGRE